MIKPERAAAAQASAELREAERTCFAGKKNIHMVAQIVVRLDDSAVRHRQDDGRGSEGLFRECGQAADEPALAVRVVHDEDAVGLQMRSHILNRLLGKQVAFQPDAGIARMQRKRIDERVHDQVVLRTRLAKKSSAVGQVDTDAGIAVGLVGVLLSSDLVDHGVDLDGVHMLDAIGESRGDVVARAGTDDQDVVERLAACIAIHQVRGIVACAEEIDALHILVAHIVDIDREVPLLKADLVIGRPGDVGNGPGRVSWPVCPGDQADGSESAERVEDAALWNEVNCQCKDDREPQVSREAEERDQCEDRDSQQASEDVGRVGEDPIRDDCKSAPDFLAESEEQKRDQSEEVAGQDLDRNHPSRGVFEPNVGAEINELGRLL